MFIGAIKKQKHDSNEKPEIGTDEGQIVMKELGQAVKFKIDRDSQFSKHWIKVI